MITARIVPQAAYANANRKVFDVLMDWCGSGSLGQIQCALRGGGYAANSM